MAIELNINDSELTKILESSVNQHLESKFNDNSFLSKLGNLINQAVNNRLEKLDLDDLVTKKLEEYFQNSIDNQSTTNQLTITDDYVVNENEFITNKLHTISTAKFDNDIEVNGTLILKGKVNVDNPSWKELKEHITDQVWQTVKRENKQELVDQVRASIFFEGIEINTALIGGEPLLEENKLSSKVTSSNIKELGTLNNLTVKGYTSLNNETLNVLNTRIGINTDKPSMALELWDQEVQISLGKIRKDTGFIGRADKGELHIGVNQQSHIMINDEGEVRINTLRIGRNKITWENSPPGTAGIKGDIAFNQGSGNAIGWICTGGHNWRQF